MYKKHYKFMISGVNDYMEGVINGLMRGICYDDPAATPNYRVEEVVGPCRYDPSKQVKSVIMQVDTAPEQFQTLREIVESMYGKVDGFDFRVLIKK